VHATERRDEDLAGRITPAYTPTEEEIARAQAERGGLQAQEEAEDRA
jgi:hypothetical protein